MANDTLVKKPPVVVWVALGFIAIGGVGYWYLERETPSAQAAPATAEAKAYVKNLKFSEVELKAVESYMKQAIVEITGKITNAGDRPVSLVEVNCIFYDPYGQLVLRERVAIVRPKTGGLKPGETKSFRLPFDTLPPSWNQSMPQFVVAQIVFE